jgi:protein-tyrosine phosphatase
MSGIIPLHPEPWTEITPGLWQGGHDYQPDPDQYVLDACIAPGEFDAVFSLYRRHGIGVPDGIAHRTALIPDGPLTDDELAHVRALAVAVAQAHGSGRRVLVRCQAGYNRSGLVVGLALMRTGMTATEAIALIREKRGPHALYRQVFVAYLHDEEIRNG